MEIKQKLKNIEKRLLEIEQEKHILEFDTTDAEKVSLQLKRQFILDARNGWKTKGIWDVVVPIAVSVITAYLVSIFVATPKP